MQTPFTGVNLTRQLHEVRTLRQFRIDEGYTHRRTELHAVYADAGSGLVWIETWNGTWRLPREFLPWALEIDDRARTLLGRGDVFPCHALFQRIPDGPWEVEIFPEARVQP